MSDDCICRNNPTIDGYRLRSQGCTAHPAPVVEAEAPKEYTPEEIELACAWSDYRSAYGADPDPNLNRRDYMKFKAGFEAALGAQHNGVLR